MALRRLLVVTVAVTAFATAMSAGITALTLSATGLPWLFPAFALAIGLPLVFCPLTLVPFLLSNLRLKRMKAELERLALTDSLTELPNRRAFFAKAKELQVMAGGEGSLIAALMIDIDRFKWINDSFGHDAGDVVLRSVAATIRDSLAQATSAPTALGRVGGEEFAILLAGADAPGAGSLAEVLREAVRSTPATFGGFRIPSTVSIGVAVAGPDTNIDTLLARADEASYSSKHAGRDRVTVSTKFFEAPQSVNFFR